jgi:hypothetical protein
MYRCLLRCVLPFGVAMAVMVTPTYAMSSAPLQLPIQILDQCDAPTFNAAVGAGTCTGSGQVTFPKFLDEVNKHQAAPQWHFAPSQRQLQVGQGFNAVNSGGETHTFTEVDKFGGGIVPLLNSLSGATVLAPECTDGTVDPTSPNGFLTMAQPAIDSKVPPGHSFGEIEGADDVGHPVMYQCCIHPWMHEVLTVRP